MEKNYRVAFVGNPNVGKSTIFNNLTGLNQHTGNWIGKTVENAEGNIEIDGENFKLIDIPGTYSIMSNSEEEKIARDFICFGNPDVTVIVVDGTCLERNLNLVFQIMEITDKVILCVNLLDEAKKNGIYVDLKKLEAKLGIPVVGTIARKKKSLKNLIEVIKKVSKNEIVLNPIKIRYEKEIENHIKNVKELVIKENMNLKKLVSDKLFRWVAIKIIENDSDILGSIEENLKFDLKSDEIKRYIDKIKISTEDFKEIITSYFINFAEKITKEVCKFENNDYNLRDRKIDKILTSKKYGIPLMIMLLGLVFWLTIVGANYPSEILMRFFNYFQIKLIKFFVIIKVPKWILSLCVYGIYQTLTWIVSVMLPPMAIFFPLFTILEECGFLPRIAFNMDGLFKRACCSGKQIITMCMGFGCNACGVTGCRIIDSPRERLIAILTNNFVPCNGRFPFIIMISTIFIYGCFKENLFFGSILSTLVVVCVIIFGIILTLLISKLLSKTILKGEASSLILELPPYRKPQFSKILIRSLFDKTLVILGRAISIAAPAGIVIWLFANLNINGNSLLTIIANFLNPFGKLMGLDGYILTAFIFGIPANEIVLPILLMCYLKGGVLVNLEDIIQIKNILISNGWNILTATNVMIFSILHFPCATTLYTIKKETKSLKWTLYSFFIPTISGIIVCIFTNCIYNIINFIK